MKTLVKKRKVNPTFTRERKKKYMGSDCVHCSLEEGITCMMYFCKVEDRKEGPRQICRDNFTAECENYEKPKRKKIKKQVKAKTKTKTKVKTKVKTKKTRS